MGNELSVEIMNNQKRNVYTYLAEENLAEDGDCYVKCLQEVYRWFGKNITSSKIVGMINSVSLKYENKELCQIVCCENWERIDGLIVNEKKVQFSSLKEGTENIKRALEAEKITILNVNTYYLDYTDDYKKLSGGYFRTGHSLIVHGFDDDEQMFIISDPTFKIMNKKISYEILGLAWTYTQDSDEFVPLKASIYSKSENMDYISIMWRALEENLKLFFEENGNYKQYLTWKDVRCINEMIYTLDKSIEKNRISEDHEILENVAYSIYHYVRWSRKSFGAFLNSEEFKKIAIPIKNIEFWEETFDMWSLIGMQMYRVVYSLNYEKLLDVRKRIVNQISKEIVMINELMTSLKLVA